MSEAELLEVRLLQAHRPQPSPSTLELSGMEGILLGLYRDNGKQSGNYYSILGLYWDNGKENGNSY